ncbi:hypothetical protein [Salirhabdus salicampi]|uniref:hypothetical protein n=1 Tax=Salirhabdus salicampi TaxID=476102 RepID=UPI0020C1C317|nr:hypothetical protein [Salirhabdus salicampi]MCP8615704.1 hypothetical protein [Salirhabdus salicampi]
MKKTVLLFLTFFLLLSVSIHADGVDPLLDQADITITVTDDNGYYVEEVITISNSSSLDGVINHSLVDADMVSDLTFTANGEALDYQLNEGEVLDKLEVTVADVSTDNLQYVIGYSVHSSEGEFKTPIVVPMYPTAGESAVVNVNFVAPEGNYIHKNSFPVQNETAEGEVTNHLINVPSHVNYIYGPEPTPLFNSYSVISGIIFVVLVGILVSWFRAERKKEMEVAA